MLGLAACTGNTTAGGGQGGQLVQAEGAPSTPTGTLRVATWEETPSFDPALMTTQNSALVFPEYDTLTSVDDKFRPQPWLATSWTEPDKMTWRFKLRTDVTFHDGAKFDAETVKLNLDRDRKITGGPYSNIYTPITKVDVVDPSTVDVKFAQPTPNFPYSMSLPAGAMVSPKAIKDKTDLTRHPAGSGGWIWDKAKHQEGSRSVFEANPNYWNKAAVKAKTIQVDVIQEDNARLNAVQTGQDDIIATVPPDQIDTAKGAGMTVLSRPSTTGSFMIFDRAGKIVPAFAKPQVRKAIGLLLDRSAYNKAVLSGQGDARSGGFAAQGTPWYDPSLNDLVKPNVAEAKRLLAAAGYPHGFSFEVGNQPVIKDINEAIAQLLAAGGIKMKIIDVGDGQYTAEVRKGRFPAGYLVPTSVDIYQWWSRTVSDKGIFNPFKLNDLADLEKTYQKAIAAPDDAARKPLFDTLQKASIERGVIFPLSQVPNATALTGRVHASRQPVLAPDDVAPRPYYLWAQ
jgi:peptide/nickel transport system substrate-binding protein